MQVTDILGKAIEITDLHGAYTQAKNFASFTPDQEEMCYFGEGKLRVSVTEYWQHLYNKIANLYLKHNPNEKKERHCQEHQAGPWHQTKGKRG